MKMKLRIIQKGDNDKYVIQRYYGWLKGWHPFQWRCLDFQYYTWKELSTTDVWDKVKQRWTSVREIFLKKNGLPMEGEEYATLADAIIAFQKIKAIFEKDHLLWWRKHNMEIVCYEDQIDRGKQLMIL